MGDNDYQGAGQLTQPPSRTKREVASIQDIKYAIVRDIIGSNVYFIGQSGTEPKKYFDDIPTKAGKDKKDRLGTLLSQAWGVSLAELRPE